MWTPFCTWARLPRTAAVVRVRPDRLHFNLAYFSSVGLTVRSRSSARCRSFACQCCVSLRALPEVIGVYFLRIEWQIDEVRVMEHISLHLEEQTVDLLLPRVMARFDEYCVVSSRPHQGHTNRRSVGERLFATLPVVPHSWRLALSRMAKSTPDTS